MSELADLVVQSRSRLTHTAPRASRSAAGWSGSPVCPTVRGVELVLTDEGWERLNTMARTHVESVRKHLLDVMGADEFAALGTAMGKVRDAALGIHEAVVAEACAEAELEWAPGEAGESPRQPARAAGRRSQRGLTRSTPDARRLTADA
jgi:hypothetical protein